MVAQTMEALASSQPAFTLAPSVMPITTLPATPTPSQGQVRGRVCYRTAAMSTLTLYFKNISTGAVIDIPVSRPQSEYDILLDPGTYEVFGWPPDYTVGVVHAGGTFQVLAGQETPGIDVCEWRYGPNEVPYPPGYAPATGSGSISGGIYGYPYGGLPNMYVVAFNQDTGQWRWVGTAIGQAWFSFDELPAGHYQIVAYDASGNAGGCMTIVFISGGSQATCDCNDWAGGYPAMPSGIP